MPPKPSIIVLAQHLLCRCWTIRTPPVPRCLRRTTPSKHHGGGGETLRTLPRRRKGVGLRVVCRREESQAYELGCLGFRTAKHPAS